MEFLFELLLTALISIFIASLLGKLFSSPSSDPAQSDASDSGARLSELDHSGAREELLQQEEKIIEVDKAVDNNNKRDSEEEEEEEDEREETDGMKVISPIERVEFVTEGEKRVEFVEQGKEVLLIMEKEERLEEERVNELKIEESCTTIEKDQIFIRQVEILDDTRPNENERDMCKLEGPICKIEEKNVEIDEEYEEWEGIERSETEKQFGLATGYANSESGMLSLSGLSSDVQLQLYGLHKIALEGPCYESQPIALRSAARAKWNAWQRLGNMNPELAMEQYMNLLSENIPEWMGDLPAANIKQDIHSHEQLTLQREMGNASCMEVGPTENVIDKGISTDQSV